jgi:pimeloyl-ACP methyl ester carboxylesterase/DNA-binding CsgD family transcriptional regulator
MAHNPQQIRFCSSADGTRIAYAVCGEGPPLVMAGQSFSHLENEWDCLVRQPMLALLSQQHTLIRYDMRGTGLSDRDCKEFALARYLEDLEAVVAASRIESFAMIGLTGGGALAVNHAARHPKQVTRLLLVGAYLRGRFVRCTTPSEHEETELILKLVELGWGQDNPTFRQLFTYQFLPDGTAAQLQSFDELMRTAASAKNAALQLRAWFSADISAVAPQVKAPTLVLHSRGDLRVPFEQGRLLAASIPGARFVPLDSRNHLPLIQEPAWLQLTAELTAFLPVDSVPTVSPVATLTPREHAVLDVLALGLDTPLMAERLCLSEKTVRNHLSAVYGKLGVSSRVQALLWIEAHQDELVAAKRAATHADRAAQTDGKDWVPPWERARK